MGLGASRVVAMEAMVSGLRCNSRHGEPLTAAFDVSVVAAPVHRERAGLVIKKYSYRSDMPAIHDVQTEKISQVIGDWCMSCMTFQY